MDTHLASALIRPNSRHPNAWGPLPWPGLPRAPKCLLPPSRPGAARSRCDPLLARLRLRAHPPEDNAPLTFLLCLLFLFLLFRGGGGAAAAAGLRRRCSRAPHGRGAQWRRAVRRAEVSGEAEARLGRGELAHRRRAAGRLTVARAGSSGRLHVCATGGTIAVARSSLSRSRSAAGGEVTDGREAAGWPRRGREERGGERGGEGKK